MSAHKISVQWRRNTDSFAYDVYDRTHELRFEGGQVLSGSAAPEYLGQAQYANPEEMLAAALASCHMLTFLAIAAKSRWVVDEYADQAEAILEKDANGILCVTKVVLRPRIAFGGATQPDPTKVQEMHEKAHKHCFIANSVSCEVRVEPRA